MNLNAEVLSISKQSINLQSPKGVPFRVLAFANVKVPELGATFARIALTHSEHGYRAMAPNGHVRGRNSGEPTIYWRADSPLCQAVLAAILAAYDLLTPPQRSDDEPKDAGGVLRTLRAEAEICDQAGL